MKDDIVITSPRPEALLNYPLAILNGQTTDKDAMNILISTHDNPHPNISFPVHNGEFTVQYMLQPGKNIINLCTVGQEEIITASTILTYEPLPTDSPMIRMVYVKGSDSDGSFQSPETVKNGEKEAKERLGTLGLILQSSMAELLYYQGLPRRTFHVDPEIHTLSLDITESVLQQKDGMDLYLLIHEKLPYSLSVINVAVMSFTKFINGQIYAHTALGGGHLALFGGASLFTWPEKPEDIPLAFLNNSKLDKNSYFDDSANRAEHHGLKAIAATTIGACLHELGHCLSLPHPFGKGGDQRGGIMGRGFDFIDKLFIQTGNDDDPVPYWDRGSAIRLHFHPMLRPKLNYNRNNRTITQPRQNHSWSISSAYPSPSPSPNSTYNPHGESETSNGIERDSQKKPTFKKELDGSVHCLAKCGIGHIGYYCNGDNASHEEFLASHPTDFVLPSLSRVLERCGGQEGDKISVSVIDTVGNIVEVVYRDIC